MDTRDNDGATRAIDPSGRVEPTAQRIGPTPDAAAEAWRRERLYLYLYWLERRDRSPFHFVGGWHTADIGDEFARWKDVLRDLDNEAALELVERELSLRFGKTWQQALLQGASPLLAAASLPIWNAATASLLPAQLGRLTIFRAESYEGKPALGWSYTYGRAGSSEKLTLTLYNQGCAGLVDGVRDPQLQAQVQGAWHDIIFKVQTSGGWLLDASVHGPVEETLLDRYNRKVELVAMRGQAVDSDQVARFEALCMRVFRQHFLKVRYTRRAALGEGRDTAVGLDAVKADLADFVVSFL